MCVYRKTLASLGIALLAIGGCVEAKHSTLTGITRIDKHFTENRFEYYHPYAARQIAQLFQYCERGEYENALTPVDEMIGVQSSSPWFHAYKAYLLAKLDRLEEALKEAEKAISEDADYDVCYGARAYVRYESALKASDVNLFRESIADYSKAVLLSKSDEATESYYIGQIRCYLALNDQKSALKLVERKWAEPESKDMHSLRAEIFGLNGQKERAKEEERLAAISKIQQYFGPDWHQLN